MKQFLRNSISEFKFLVLRWLQWRFIYTPLIREHLYVDNGGPLFDAVFFEVRSKCNGQCSFCAASVQNEIRPDVEMSFFTYQVAIDQLQELGFKGRIAYHINNDPLLFAPLAEFVEYARKSLPEAWIQILTNGRSLRSDLAERLLQAGINELSINYYNDDLDADLPERIKSVRDHIIPKFYSGDAVREGFGPLDTGAPIFRFNVFRRKQTAVLETRGGSSPNALASPKKPRGFCQYPFTQLNVNAAGDVSKCCSDFYFSHIMGNIHERRLFDIWYGPEFSRVRLSLLSGDRSNLPNCKDCDFFGCFGGDRLLKKTIQRKVYSLTK